MRSNVLRVLFLAVIAVSSLVALYASQRNFEPTPFSGSFQPGTMIERAMKELGVVAQGGAGGGGGSRSKFVSRSYRSTYQPVPGTTQSAVLIEVRKIVRKQILDSGCRINGSGETGSVDNETQASFLTEFEIEYENRNATGLIRVRTTRGEQTGYWEFWFDIIEF